MTWDVVIAAFFVAGINGDPDVDRLLQTFYTYGKGYDTLEECQKRVSASSMSVERFLRAVNELDARLATFQVVCQARGEQ